MRFSPRWQQRLATAGLVYCAAIWGSTFFVVKDAVSALDPLLLVGYRFLLGAALLGPFVAWRSLASRRGRAVPTVSGGTAPAPPSSIAGYKAGIILGSVLWVLYAAQTAGLVYTSAANSGFITGLFIIFVPLLAWLLYRRRPQALQLLAVGVATAGLALLTGGLSELNAGDLLTLAAAVTYAWHVLLADEYSQARLDPYVMCFMQTLVTGLLGLTSARLLGLRPGPLGAHVIWQLVFLAAFPTVSAFLIQLWAQRIVPPTRVVLIFTLEPVFAALFAWTWGHEQFRLIPSLGGLLIVASMLLTESTEAVHP